jgi:hypothetical protein
MRFFKPLALGPTIFTMHTAPRLRAAAFGASVHLICSLVVAVLAGVLVFGLWYPYPYRELSGGRELFFLIVAVDVVCGPLLTMVLFNPAKPRAELWRDLGMVAIIQLAALGYGLFTVWLARPLFLVQEVDRFKVVMAPDLDAAAVAALPVDIQAQAWGGPRIVAIRPPASVEEKNRILFAAIEGGRDYAERPEFYLPYEGTNALKSLKAAKPLAKFLTRWPEQQAAAEKLAVDKKLDLAQLMYLPVTGRQDWVAVLDKQGQIQGFLKGDGF